MMISAINDEGMSDFESSEESSMNDYAADQNAATDGEEELRLLHKENSAEVSRWRGVAIIMLFLTAAFVITTSYVFLSREETDEFEKSYQQSARTLRDATIFYARNVVGASYALGDSITNAALASNQSWPFVTIDNFEIAAAHARLDGETELIIMSPLIPGSIEGLWENYAQGSQGWLEESQELGYQTSAWSEDPINSMGLNLTGKIPLITERIYRLGENFEPVTNYSTPLYAPAWQISPAPFKPSLVNYDLLSNPAFQQLFNVLVATQGTGTGLSAFFDPSFTNVLYEGIYTDEAHMATHNMVQGGEEGLLFQPNEQPHTVIVTPIRSNFGPDGGFVGLLSAVISSDKFLSGLLPEGVNGVYVVITNTCNQAFTYIVNGPIAVYVGPGDLHQTEYDYLEETIEMSNEVADTCDFKFSIYPSSTYRAQFNSPRPELFTAIMAGVFIATGAVFVIYVLFVQRRQNKIVATAHRTNAIVSSLFPSNVRDRILQEAQEQVDRDVNNRYSLVAAKHRLKNFLEDDPGQAGSMNVFGTKPIADLFPETTIMFGDLVGFTAWSSVREPSQVFTLLETVYHAFDQLAKRRGVFKVETVGDCYVAVTGLPEPRKDHALAMARFARDCNAKLMRLVKQLEVTLGPDTGDLSMRFGLHSGPVTAGVLRGERARFQLFGDTMNTAARIESTGERGKIHLSEETADLLITSGKKHWLRKRGEMVSAKGKGELQTYWLNTRAAKTATGSVMSMSSSVSDHSAEEVGGVFLRMSRHGGGDALHKTTSIDYPKLANLDEKVSRLVDWNFDLLLRSLKEIVTRRGACSGGQYLSSPDLITKPGSTVLEEVKEIITLPNFDAQTAQNEVDLDIIVLGAHVEAELHDYVVNIAMMYRDNPFHNFEHASHVTMSVVKLLSRVVAPSDIQVEDDKLASSLHDHTYGITSDPLTQFACIFSALIHDVDHIGVPNSQLIQENAAIATLYKNKSVAEQNSVELAWDLLMEDRYDNLRSTIYATDDELKRFRQLVVNSVMATDIMDKDLKALRNGRWDKAFNDAPQENSLEAVNRKATIVIEHLIQASDVSHTMQHWHIYRKWNERLFAEMFKAYMEGRAAKDPSEFWYKGEIGFFDFYIIPLAKKLKDCGVFGVSSFEYLDYAERNRAEWECKGQEAVETMMEKIKGEYAVKQNLLR